MGQQWRRQRGGALRVAVMSAVLACAPAAAWAQEAPAAAPAPAPAAAAAPASVLDVLPAGAQLVVVMPNLAQLNTNLANLNTAMGGGVPMLGDALGEFKRNMGMNKGVNDAGAMAMTVMDLAAAQQGQPAVLMFVPVNNYADFLSNYGSNQVNGDAELTLPTGHVAHVRQVGGFAVMAPDKAILEAYKPGQAQAAYRELAGKTASSLMDGSDMAMLIDVQAVAPTVLPMLDEAMKEATQQLDAQPVPNAAMAKMAMQTYFDAFRAVMTDTSAVFMGMDVREPGVGMTFAAQFKPGSNLAKWFGNGGGGVEGLKRLPNQPYLAAMGMDMRGIAVGELVDKLAARLQDPAFGQMAQLVRDALPMVRNIKSVAQVYYVPAQVGFNSSLFNGVAVIDAGQGAQFRDAYRAYVSKMDQMRMDLGPLPGPDGKIDPAAPPAVMTFSAQYTDNALQVEGVQVDQYAISYTLPPQLMQQMGQAGGMMMMMGGTNQTGYIAVKDQYAIVTSTPDAQLVKAALASLKAGNGLSAQPSVTQVNQSLTPNPSMVGYLSVAGIGQTVSQFMMMMGGGQQMINVPADLPPVAMSVSLQDGGVAKRLFVPLPVITFVSTTAQTMMMQMQPPGANGAQPQQGPPPAPF